jgi:predicted NAD-dependent protein-ADP-ribosyltransferase YbiA (DUF1768 family)
MATPVTLRKLDEKIERNKKKNAQRQSQQPSMSYVNPTVPNNNQVQNIRSHSLDFSRDIPIVEYDFDDWTYQPPTNPSVAPKKRMFNEFVVKKDEVYLFHGKDHFMSTFYEAPFTLTNHKYPNVETYYEACKLYCLVDSSYAPLLQKARYAAEAKKIASNILRKYNVSRKVVNQFKRHEGAHAVYNATYAKFNDNPELKKKLLETGNKLIIHSYDKDDIFASGCSEAELTAWLEKNNGIVIKIPTGRDYDSKNITKVGKGLNLLGFFCMSIREQLRIEEANMVTLQTLSLL